MEMSPYDCKVISMKTNLELTQYGNYKSPNDPGELFSGIRGARRSSVTDEEATILSKLVHGLIVLEVGTGLGISTMALAKYAMHVTTVDIDPWVNNIVLPKDIERLMEIPNRHFHIAFLDGSHMYEDVMYDIKQVKAPLFIMHDCFLEGVIRAVNDSKLQLVETYKTRCDMRLYKR